MEEAIPFLAVPNTMQKSLQLEEEEELSWSKCGHNTASDDISGYIPRGNVKPHHAMEKGMRGNLAAIVTSACVIQNRAYDHMMRPQNKLIPYNVCENCGDMNSTLRATTPS
jgi:hypothetical protein